MKPFLLYTTARLVLFAVCWLAVWLVATVWLDRTVVTALWTALIALAVSAVLALVLLRRLRDELAASVAARADRVREGFESARRKEDDGDGS
ncbi:MAG: DUF4229 domain-containing protein [Propionibacteriales bacterium]|nr:DUF4229 domain-containing protein [Propionibacteriales bacterium]